MMKKLPKKSTTKVALLLLSDGKDGNTPTAHLVRRPTTTDESVAQKWPDCCVLPVGGKILGGETELTALRRLLNATFGDRTGEISTLALLSPLSGRNRSDYIIHTNKQITMFALLVPERIFDLMRPTIKGGKFVQVTAADLENIIEAKDEWKFKPHGIKKAIVVIPPAHKAIRTALRMYKPMVTA